MVWAMSSPQTRAAQAACEDEALALRVAGQPDDWRAWAERARWHATGSWVTADSALAFASRAYRLAPGDAYVRSMLATALLRAGPTSGGSALAEPLTMGVVESATIDRPHGTRGWALLALAGDPRLLEHWPAANGRRTASPLLLTHCLDLLAAAGEEQSPGVRALLGLPLRAGQPSDATAAALVTSSWPEHLVESAEAQVAASRARSGAGSPLPLWLGPAILASGRFELLPDSFNIRDPAAGTYYGRLLETDVAAAFALSPHSTEAQRDQARRWLSARAELLEDVYSIVLPLRLPEFPAVELGAIQSFLGQREAAFATLYRARSRGYGNVAHLRNHVMFDSIRGDARFGRLVETMEEQRSDMRDRFLDYSEHPSIAGAERLVAGCDAVRTANLESIDRLVGSVLGVTR